jgi:uncharacterized protein (TIGR03086 family)
MSLRLAEAAAYEEQSAMTTTDIRDLDRRAVLASVAAVSQVNVADLGRPTPCAGWTLGDLLAHMAAQHRGFAAAAAGQGADQAVWQAGPLGDNPAAYADAANQVLVAFADDAVLARRFSLPEISATLSFPASQAIGFHFVDYVAHGWDVSRSLDVPFELDPDVVDAALRIALAVPDDESRLRPGAAFAPSVAAPETAEPLDRVMSALGRSPNWPEVS